MMHPATIYLGQRRRGDGLARAEEGSGEESARASAFCFGEIGAGYKIENALIFVIIILQVKTSNIIMLSIYGK
jgi:hypothetical protein